MVTKGNIHNLTNWPQSVSTSSCAIRKGLKYIECHTQCIYCTRMATTWRSDCLTEVKVIKSNSVGPRKRLRGADEGRLNSGPLNAGLTLIAFTRQLTWSCKSPWLVHVTLLQLWINTQTSLLLVISCFLALQICRAEYARLPGRASVQNRRTQKCTGIIHNSWKWAERGSQA